jgi:hypothetical protein
MSGPDIAVTQSADDPSGFAFTVEVSGDDGSPTLHDVTLAREMYDRLARVDESATAFVRRCFAFLLERESKDSILAQFDVAVIPEYFPEFEETISA